MTRFWKRIILYAKLPEMRLSWILLPVLVVLSGINLFFLPSPLGLVTLGIFFALMIIITWSSLRLTKSNLEIKVERNELSSIVTNLNDGIIAYDSGFKILIFNRAAETIFGIKSQSVTGQIFSPDRSKESEFRLLTQVIFPSLAPSVVSHSAPGVFPQISDVSFSEPNLNLRVVTDRILDPNGQLLGFVKIVRDRTREVELLQAKTEFISVAAHQLRTPLSAINWSFENILGMELKDDAKEAATTGRNAAAKMSKTVNDLLDVSKIEEGRFGYNFESVNLSEFVEGVIAETQELNKQTTVKIYFKKPAEEVGVYIDKEKLRIALFNFLDNSIKYNVENGEVVVGISRLPDKPYVEVSVKDTGLGISADEIKKLFTKFFRAENITDVVTEGTGLGLYISKNIVRRHGGEVRVESELNRGSTFYFTLPTDFSLVPARETASGEE
ncbi:MAG: ATP-binding protein [Candidatus Wolfebacteria bacterium]|nr:ATP-binding protein [Candidatus Wolfebacteria bacterium]